MELPTVIEGGNVLRKMMYKVRASFAPLAVAICLAISFSALAGVATDTGITNAEVKFATAAGNTLYLQEVPSLDFGTRNIGSTDRYYPHSNGGDTKVVVHDIRGSKSGWKVLLTLSPFTSGTFTLGNAEVTFKTPNSVSSNVVPLPTPMPYLGTSAMDTAVTVPADGVTPKQLLTANANTGMAETVFKWTTNTPGTADGTPSPVSTSKIELKVPGATARGLTYTATLTWNLQNAP